MATARASLEDALALQAEFGNGGGGGRTRSRKRPAPRGGSPQRRPPQAQSTSSITSKHGAIVHPTPRVQRPALTRPREGWLKTENPDAAALAFLQNPDPTTSNPQRTVDHSPAVFNTANAVEANQRVAIDTVAVDSPNTNIASIASSAKGLGDQIVRDEGQVGSQDLGNVLQGLSLAPLQEPGRFRRQPGQANGHPVDYDASFLTHLETFVEVPGTATETLLDTQPIVNPRCQPLVPEKRVMCTCGSNREVRGLENSRFNASPRSGQQTTAQLREHAIMEIAKVYSGIRQNTGNERHTDDYQLAHSKARVKRLAAQILVMEHRAGCDYVKSISYQHPLYFEVNADTAAHFEVIPAQIGPRDEAAMIPVPAQPAQPAQMRLDVSGRNGMETKGIMSSKWA